MAITLEPARTAELAPLLLQRYELSPREREVALLVTHGLDTREISEALCISPYTVQDHLKVIFDKVRVRSRRELLAEIFYASPRRQR